MVPQGLQGEVGGPERVAREGEEEGEEHQLRWEGEGVGLLPSQQEVVEVVQEPSLQNTRNTCSG